MASDNPWGLPEQEDNPVDAVDASQIPTKCPQCGGPTKIYIAHQKNKNVFLGCGSFPDCKFAHQLPEEMRKLYARSLQHHTRFASRELRKWAERFDARKKTFSFLNKLADRLDDIIGKKGY